MRSAYVALDSSNAGHLQYLAFGPDRTHEHPPHHAPDGLGWRYLYCGEVDLDQGMIRDAER